MLLKAVSFENELRNERIDFQTLEEELPAQVMPTAAGATERSTSITDVKTETTDEN